MRAFSHRYSFLYVHAVNKFRKSQKREKRSDFGWRESFGALFTPKNRVLFREVLIAEKHCWIRNIGRRELIRAGGLAGDSGGGGSL
jgi:hypothetical protein